MMMAALRLSFTRIGRGSGVAIVLSGIQSTGPGQAMGISPVLEEQYGRVHAYDYNNVSWRRPEKIAAEIAEDVAYWQAAEGFVAIYGLSVGALMGALVTAAIRQIRARQDREDRLPLAKRASVSPDRYYLVMIDPPFGAPTMMGVPDWMMYGPTWLDDLDALRQPPRWAKRFPRLGKFVARLRAPKWLDNVQGWIYRANLPHKAFATAGVLTPSFVKIRKLEVPEDSQLERPSDEDMRAMFPNDDMSDIARYRKRARMADVANQKGHGLRTWFQQLAWMTGRAANLPYEHIMDGVRADIIIADSARNTVVRSRDASAEMKRLVRFDNWHGYRVDAEHCATLRHQPAYAAALRRLHPLPVLHN